MNGLLNQLKRIKTAIIEGNYIRANNLLQTAITENFGMLHESELTYCQCKLVLNEDIESAIGIINGIESSIRRSK